MRWGKSAEAIVAQSIRSEGPNLNKTIKLNTMRADKDAEGAAEKSHALPLVGGRILAGSGKSASNPTSEEEPLIVQRQELIEQMIDRGNLNAAWKRVARNKGSAGVDGRGLEETAQYIRNHQKRDLRSSSGRDISSATSAPSGDPQAQWRQTPAGNTDGFGPLDPTGSPTSANSAVRTALLGAELWV